MAVSTNSPAPYHPSIAALLPFFQYAHLPPTLARMAEPFAKLAHALADDKSLAGPEVTVGLRKLLEARDCAVRAAL